MSSIKHIQDDMKQTYCNIAFINITGVDLGIGFGLTQDTADPDIVNANYHTMVRMSYEQAKILLEQLNDAIESTSSDEKTEN